VTGFRRSAFGLRVIRGGRLHFGQLPCGGSVLMHVTLRGEGVDPNVRFPVWRLERILRRIGRQLRATDDSSNARPLRHQGNAALAGSYCNGGVTDVTQIGGTAGEGRIGVTQALEANIFGERNSPEAELPIAKIAIDILQPQPRIGERPQGHLGVNLRSRSIRKLPAGMLVGTHN